MKFYDALILNKNSNIEKEIQEKMIYLMDKGFVPKTIYLNKGLLNQLRSRLDFIKEIASLVQTIDPIHTIKVQEYKYTTFFGYELNVISNSCSSNNVIVFESD